MTNIQQNKGEKIKILKALLKQIKLISQQGIEAVDLGFRAEMDAAKLEKQIVQSIFVSHQEKLKQKKELADAKLKEVWEVVGALSSILTRYVDIVSEIDSQLGSQLDRDLTNDTKEDPKSPKEVVLFLARIINTLESYLVKLDT